MFFSALSPGLTVIWDRCKSTLNTLKLREMMLNNLSGTTISCSYCMKYLKYITHTILKTNIIKETVILFWGIDKNLFLDLLDLLLWLFAYNRGQEKRASHRNRNFNSNINYKYIYIICGATNINWCSVEYRICSYYTSTIINRGLYTTKHVYS